MQDHLHSINLQTIGKKKTDTWQMIIGQIIQIVPGTIPDGTTTVCTVVKYMIPAKLAGIWSCDGPTHPGTLSTTPQKEHNGMIPGSKCLSLSFCDIFCLSRIEAQQQLQQQTQQQQQQQQQQEQQQVSNNGPLPEGWTMKWHGAGPARKP